MITLRRERDISWTGCCGSLLEGRPARPLASIMLLNRIQQNENKRGQCETCGLRYCLVSIVFNDTRHEIRWCSLLDKQLVKVMAVVAYP